jgi:hypothetical protein
MNLTFAELSEEPKPYIQSFWVFETPLGMLPTDANLAAQVVDRSLECFELKHALIDRTREFE